MARVGRLGLAWPASDAVTLGLLRKIAPHYLTRPARHSWFEDALKEATTPLEDAIWALQPTTTGVYRLFDPLLDYGTALRSFEPIPPDVWSALQAAPLTREDFETLADKAGNRLLFGHAQEFVSLALNSPTRSHQNLASSVYHPTSSTPSQTTSRPPAPAPTGAGPVKLDLSGANEHRARADRLLEADDLDGLREMAVHSQDSYIRRRLAMLYERRSDIENLRELAKFSNRGGRHYVEFLAEQGNLAELLRLVVCGDGMAIRALKNWTITGLSDQRRDQILQDGLNPDGTPAIPHA